MNRTLCLTDVDNTTRHRKFTGGGSEPFVTTEFPHQSDEEYRADNALSHTQLERFRRNPEDFFQVDVAATRTPSPPTPSMIIGQRLHGEVLRPPWYTGLVRVPYDVLTSNGQRRGKKWEAWRDEHAGEDIVTDYEAEQIETMADMLRDNLAVYKLLSDDDVRTEFGVTWESDTYGSEGLRLKCRFDIICPDRRTICDIKTTSVNSFRNLQRVAYTIDDYGYARQAYHYSGGASALFGRHEWQWLIAFVMNQPPYSVQVVELDPAWVRYEGEKCIGIRRELCRCIASGSWQLPTQGDIVRLSAPRNQTYSEMYEVNYDD